MKMISIISFTLFISICSAFTLKRNTVRIRVSKEVIRPVLTPKNVTATLKDYMQLPSAQYTCVPMPLNSSLTRIIGSDEEFLLSVPKIKFLLPIEGIIEIVPKVRANVKVESDRVLISSNSCTISGSPIVEQLNIASKFDFRIFVILTWKEGLDGDDILSRANIEIDFYPPGKLALIPRRIQEFAGKTSMSFVLSKLLKTFMENLASDYERWVSDKDYRIQRREMQKEFDAEFSKRTKLN